MMTECRVCESDCVPGELYEHHVSYEPEEAIMVCGSCHMRIHSKDPYGAEYLPDTRGYDHRDRIPSMPQKRMAKAYPAVAEEVDRIVAEHDAPRHKAWRGVIRGALDSANERLR